MQNTLAKLLTLPEPDFDWEPGKDSTLLALDFTPDDAADLIAIANFKHIPDHLDSVSTDADWHAATSAYRALAELDDPAHLEVFLGLTKLPKTADDDLLTEDLIAIIPRYGEAAVDPCLTAMEDQTINENDRTLHTEILEELATSGHRKDQIIQRFASYLEQKHFTRNLNACIVAALVDLEATSAIESIRACYRANLADITMNGDLEEVELDLGLRDARSSESHPGWSELEEKSLHLAIKADLGPRPDDGVDLFIYLYNLYSRECSADGLTGLHAQLTGALLSPRFVKPSEYLPYIWDTQNNKNPYSPNWESKEDAEFFLQFMMVLHNQIVNSLDKGSFEPVPNERDSHPGSEFYSLWLLTLNRSLGHWNPADSPENLSEDQLQIVSHTAAVIQEETLAIEQDKAPDTRAEIDRLRRTLCGIHKKNKASIPLPSFTSDTYYTGQHTQENPKISRNAPCPCGSGKKYKRCCLN